MKTFPVCAMQDKVIAVVQKHKMPRASKNPKDIPNAALCCFAITIKLLINYFDWFKVIRADCPRNFSFC